MNIAQVLIQLVVSAFNNQGTDLNTRYLQSIIIWSNCSLKNKSMSAVKNSFYLNT